MKQSLPEKDHLKTTDRGRQTERACRDYLSSQGLQPVEQNYRTRSGEIDLIMRDGNTLVFVEVRYRKNGLFGSAIESVDYNKQGRILRTVSQYCQQHNIDQAIRIDIVGMSTDRDGRYHFEWIQNALQAD